MATTARILTQTNRQGTLSTASAVIPADAQTARVTAVVSDAQLSDPQNTVLVNVYVSPDGSFAPATTVHLISKGWHGGTHIDKWTGLEVPNELEIGFGPLEPYWGWRIRADIDIARTMRLGADLTLDPDPVAR